jgi:hypothetical protein
MGRLSCNITRRGRIVRAISGLVLVALGVAAGFGLLGVQTLWIRVLLAAALGAIGVFQLFEARAGWCAVRALGIKTPL